MSAPAKPWPDYPGFFKIVPHDPRTPGTRPSFLLLVDARPNSAKHANASMIDFSQVPDLNRISRILVPQGHYNFSPEEYAEWFRKFTDKKLTFQALLNASVTPVDSDVIASPAAGTEMIRPDAALLMAKVPQDIILTKSALMSGISPQSPKSLAPGIILTPPQVETLPPIEKPNATVASSYVRVRKEIVPEVLREPGRTLAKKIKEILETIEQKSRGATPNTTLEHASPSPSRKNLSVIEQALILLFQGKSVEAIEEILRRVYPVAWADLIARITMWEKNPLTDVLNRSVYNQILDQDFLKNLVQSGGIRVEANDYPFCLIDIINLLPHNHGLALGLRYIRAQFRQEEKVAKEIARSVHKKAKLVRQALAAQTLAALNNCTDCASKGDWWGAIKVTDTIKDSILRIYIEALNTPASSPYDANDILADQDGENIFEKILQTLAGGFEKPVCGAFGMQLAQLLEQGTLFLTDAAFAFLRDGLIQRLYEEGYILVNSEGKDAFAGIYTPRKASDSFLPQYAAERRKYVETADAAPAALFPPQSAVRSSIPPKK